jgi:hypothetical protein
MSMLSSVPDVSSEIFGGNFIIVNKFLPALKCGTYVKETEHLLVALPFVYHIMLPNYLERTF